jgi:hypothetical protein
MPVKVCRYGKVEGGAHSDDEKEYAGHSNHTEEVNNNDILSMSGKDGMHVVNVSGCGMDWIQVGWNWRQEAQSDVHES